MSEHANEPQAPEGDVEGEAQPEQQPEAPAEPQFDPQAAYGHLAGQVDEIRNAVAQMYQPGEAYQPEQPQADEFDPFDQNSFSSAVERAVDQRFSRLEQALAPMVEHFNDERSESYVNENYTRLGVPEDVQNEVLLMSAGYRMAGQGPEQALASAWQAIQGLRGAATSQGRQEQRDELEEIVNAPGVPHGTQPGAVQGESKPQSMEEAARRISARLGLT